MTNSPQIPTIPQDVMEAIQAFGQAQYVAGSCLTEQHREVDATYQALLTAIAGHLRPVGPVGPVGELDKTALMHEVGISKAIAAYMRYSGVLAGYNPSPTNKAAEEEAKLPAGYMARVRQANATTQPNKSSTLPDVGDTDVLERVAEAIWLNNGGISSVYRAISAEGSGGGNIQKKKCIENAKAAIKALACEHTLQRLEGKNGNS